MPKSFFKLYKTVILLIIVFHLFIPLSYAQEDHSVVGTVRIVDNQQGGGDISPEVEENPSEIIVSEKRLTKKRVYELEARNIETNQAQRGNEEEEDEENETTTPTILKPEKNPKAAITGYYKGPIEFTDFEENKEYDVAGVSILEVTDGPVDIDILTTELVCSDFSLKLGLEPGEDTVQLKFSRDYEKWIIFTQPYIAKNFEQNVPYSSVHNFYLRLKTPTKISKRCPLTSSILIIVSEIEQES